MRTSTLIEDRRVIACLIRYYRENNGMASVKRQFVRHPSYQASMIRSVDRAMTSRWLWVSSQAIRVARFIELCSTGQPLTDRPINPIAVRRARLSTGPPILASRGQWATICPAPAERLTSETPGAFLSCPLISCSPLR